MEVVTLTDLFLFSNIPIKLALLTYSGKLFQMDIIGGDFKNIIYANHNERAF
jgi:hypothetical protein